MLSDIRRHAVDSVLRLMVKLQIPINRDSYLNISHLGDPPELDAETEAELRRLFADDGSLIQ